MTLECSLLFSLLEDFEKDQYLCKFGKISQWSLLVPIFCLQGGFVCLFINYRFYFTSRDRSVQVIYLFLIQFYHAYVSRNLTISMLSNLLADICSWYSLMGFLYFCCIGCYLSSFIFISFIWVLSLFLVSLVRDLLVLLIWQRTCLQCRRPGFDPWVRKIPWRKKWQPTPVILAWGIPWTEEPGALQFMGSQRVGHDWVSNTLRTSSCFYWLFSCFLNNLYHSLPSTDFKVFCSSFTNSFRW